MSKYKIATKTDLLRIRIAKEVFGEIEDCDGIRVIPSWEIFDKCLEQHKQITQKDHELAVMKKALELACEPRDDWGGREYDDPYTNYYDYFMDKAKEMLKDE